MYSIINIILEVKMQIFEREILKDIEVFINTKDVIVLHGARRVGKTSMMMHLINKLKGQGKNTVYIDLEDLRFVQLINKGYNNFIGYLEENNYLNKKTLYLFIDEIQYLNNPTNFLKIIHDHYSQKIKLFVSGSSSFEIKSKSKESLVGRTVNFELYPLNFLEFLLFKKSNIDLNKKSFTELTSEELKNHYTEYIIYGGYPRIVLEKNILKKEILLQQIIDTYIKKDIKDLANIKDIFKFNKLLKILASQTGNLLNVVELANTAKLSRPTVENYLFLMQNTYILKLLNPFSSNLRSELFKTPKIFFCDTGIANLLWFKTFPKTIMGNIFETSVFSELLKNKKEHLFFWRTQDKKEVDFIIRKGQKITPIEVKLTQAGFNYTSMKYFIEKYKIANGICISLEIDKRKNKNIVYKYPWEL